MTSSVSGRRLGSMPAVASVPAGRAPIEAAKGSNALASVFRRWVNMLRTIRSKSTGSLSSNGGGLKAIRISAERDYMQQGLTPKPGDERTRYFRFVRAQAPPATLVGGAGGVEIRLR